MAVASSNLNVALEDSAVRQITLRTPPGVVKGLATRPARVARAGPRAAARKMLTRGVHVLLVEESRAQVGGRNGRDDGGACLLRKGVSGLLGDIGA